MSDAQEYFDWKEDIYDALCMMHERIFILEKKVTQLEKSNGGPVNNNGKSPRTKTNKAEKTR